jgi:hypothetical protein
VGVDLEIEFIDQKQEASGRKLYLQLKSGDSHLRHRKRSGKEVFEIEKERHARYWANQAFPMMLVIGTSDGRIRWMEIGDYLRTNTINDKPLREIVFAGEAFDEESILAWRRKVLAVKTGGELRGSV